ncbi:hypothetical protein [Microbacterium sp. NPDC087591]|uniref:hypothetical protein n=1 Tax=Microbacterium sp. NPDC087591 TaxID=3364192 RepID=UPI003816284E
MEFFAGGMVLFVTAIVLMVEIPSAAQYDGIVSLIGWGIAAVVISVASMIVAMVIGLPVRLAPRLRSRWLANGEITIAGAAVGLVSCLAIVASMETPDASETSGAPDPLMWALLVARALFAISIAHFVWPMRWTTRVRD